MKPESIAEKFSKGFDCSQVVLEHFAEELGISSELANKVSACFGGGMATVSYTHLTLPTTIGV